MSFFSSIGQYVADSVAGLSLSPKRFSLSRQGSAEVPPPTPPTPAAPPSPAVQHGFPKVVPSPGAAALGTRRRTLECLAPPGAARPPRGGSLRRPNRGTAVTPGLETSPISPLTAPINAPQHRPPLAFCRRRLSWPEVDQHATSGVQETDGSYFESFTALSWKQENRRLSALRAGEARAEQPPPCESALGIQRRVDDMSSHEKESLYVEVLYTIANSVGAPAPGGQFAHYKEDLHLYTQRAFDMSPERHYRLLNVAGEEKPPIVVLSVVVLEADGLEAKDANGFSDPYCMLGIQPLGPPPVSPIPPSPRLSDPGTDTDGSHSPQHEKLRKHHSFRLSFKRRPEGGSRREHRDSLVGQLPAKFIRATSVKPHTLSPKWNEKFRFDIDDLQSDTLHLDIWDHDDESSVLDAVSKLNEVRGVRGLGRFFKQVCQSARQGSQDDFLGSVNIPLHEIPSTGMEGWFKLEARSQRSSVQGRIRLRLWLSTREDRGTSEEDNWAEVRQQEQLFGIFLGHECRQSGTGGGPLSGPAATILHQHAVQGDLSSVQVAIAHWAGAAKLNTDVPLDPRYLHKLLTELEKAWSASGRTVTKEEEQWLAESFTIFLERAMQQIRRHRELFPALHPPSLVRLEGLLRCMNFLSQMKAFWKCCPFNKEIRGEIVVSLRKGTAEWYARLAREGTRGSPNHLLELSTSLLVDLHQGLTYYHPLFETANSIPYFSIVYKQIDKMLADDVCRCLNGFEPPPPPQWSATEGTREPAHTLPFELYLGIQEVRSLAQHLPGPGQQQLALNACHEWFTPAVERWLAITRAKALNRVRAAMTLDRICEGEFIVKHSTSSVDTAACFYQAREFWRLLIWPNPTHAFQLLDSLCSAAMHYADLAHQRLADSGYYDNLGPFKTTDEMCVAVNNLEYVRRSLAEFGEDIKPDQTSDCDRARVLDTALQALETRSCHVLSRVAPQMEAPLRKAIFHLAWSPDSLPTSQAITPLLEYLDVHLATLNAMLLPRNFTKVLGGVWDGVLKGLSAQVDAPAQDRPPIFHDRLQEALEILTDFFHAEGKGLEIEELHSESFCRVEQRLQYHKTSTERLIDLFYAYRLQDQINTAQTPYGILSVRAYFNHDSLCVEVLSARDVLPLDPNGFSDPFVIVELLPRRVFSHCSEQQTNVHKKTLHPVFDECFEFSVTLEQCLAEGSMIAFTVMDHDVITANDFAGEAFLPLCNIPGVADSSSNVDNFHGLKQVDLPLMQQYERQHPILQILESRHLDKQAIDFVKKQKMRFAQ